MEPIPERCAHGKIVSVSWGPSTLKKDSRLRDSIGNIRAAFQHKLLKYLSANYSKYVCATSSGKCQSINNKRDRWWVWALGYITGGFTY
jgi:hypothetical protein